jgi:hypothetical protein
MLCTNCREDKPITEFPPKQLYRCRKCYNECHRNYKRSHPEYVKAYVQKRNVRKQGNVL